MSFILDALKKSESERQRQSVPGLLDVPMPAPRQRFPIWGVLLGLLLGVNLVVLLVVLVRSDSSRPVAAPAQPGTAPTNAPIKTPADAPTAGAQAASAAPFSPMGQAPVYAPEIPVEQGRPAQSSSPDQSAMSAAPAQMPAQAEPPVQISPRNARAALPPQAQIPVDPSEVVPTLQELNLAGNHAIPELHLDIHVYANRPGDRFVFINNRKYKEGSTLQEGPTVERITRDGVLLHYQNLRFSIPRQ